MVFPDRGVLAPVRHNAGETAFFRWILVFLDGFFETHKFFICGTSVAQQRARFHYLTGIAKQDPWRSSGLVVKDKVDRVASFHRYTVEHLQRRVSPTLVSSYQGLFTWLEPGVFVAGGVLEGMGSG